VPLLALSIKTRPGMRRSWLAVVLGAALTGLLLALAAPAGAFVTGIGATKVGLQKHNGTTLLEAGEEPANFANPSGSPVLHSNNTYAIYWDPTDHYHGDWQHLVNTFFENLGTASGSLANVFAVDTQYTDKTNFPAAYRSAFLGAYTDTSAYPAAGCTDPHPLEVGDAITCLTDQQVREQLETFVSANGLQKGMGTIFYVLTPPGVTVCVDAGGSASHCSSNSASPSSFCSYHSNIGGGDANTILYAVVPWTAGGLGDHHLLPADRTSAYDCQDGGFDPSSKPTEKRETAKEKTTKEEEEFLLKTVEEKEKLEEAEAREGPHSQEPNQVPCPSSDGGCDTGLADIIIGQISAEQQNAVTDPLLNAWQDPSGYEATDECRNDFARVLGGSATASEESGAGTLFNQVLASGAYYLNDAFNLAATKLSYPGVACLTGAALVPIFTAPTPVNAGEVVGFDGMESDITLNAGVTYPAAGGPLPNYATYTWSFGDGSPNVSGFAPGAPACTAPWLSPCAASVFHAYKYGGTYNVSLTVTDVGGHTAAVIHPVTVVGPPPPSPPTETSSGSTSSSGASSTSGGSGASPAGSGASSAGSTHVTPVPPPVVAAAVVSRSLRRVLRGGLVIRYSVNEQVAGHFEVLLGRATARRLGIGGSPAIGLPAGTPPQVIIGRAVLVTTSAGRSTVNIQFSRRTASRLARLHSLPLMLRLFVRNAASSSPATTTVLSTVTLSH
jgi:hypothetical protein